MLRLVEVRHDLMLFPPPEPTLKPLCLITSRTWWKTLTLEDSWQCLNALSQRLTNAVERRRTSHTSEADASWETFCGGFIRFGDGVGDYRYRRTVKRDRVAYDEWRAWFELYDTSPPTVAAMDFNALFPKVCVGRNFIITAKGYIGWAPELAEVGDLIVLMPGGSVPYVLRPVQSDQDAKPHDQEEPASKVGRQQDYSPPKVLSPQSPTHSLPSEMENDLEPSSNTAEVQHYTFIGDAYIHSIMHGEAWDEEKLEPIILV
jgi:hypothetical protein